MLRYTIEAKYADGYTYRGDQKDQSIFDPRRNAYYDVVESGKLTDAHGKLITWSLIGNGTRYDIDFSGFPDAAKPIYYVHRQNHRHIHADGRVEQGETVDLLYGFGYEFINQKGEKEKEVIEVA